MFKYSVKKELIKEAVEFLKIHLKNSHYYNLELFAEEMILDANGDGLEHFELGSIIAIQGLPVTFYFNKEDVVKVEVED
jgi:hypothetical protein